MDPSFFEVKTPQSYNLCIICGNQNAFFAVGFLERGMVSFATCRAPIIPKRKNGAGRMGFWQERLRRPAGAFFRAGEPKAAGSLCSSGFSPYGTKKIAPPLHRISRGRLSVGSNAIFFHKGKAKFLEHEPAWRGRGRFLHKKRRSPKFLEAPGEIRLPCAPTKRN